MSNLTCRNGIGQKTGKAGPKARKPIPRQSAKTKQRKASADGKAGALHMGKVAQLPCVICGSWPVHVHHCISGRFGQRKASDFDTIPLCWECHLGPQGIHASKHAWEAQNGPDTGFLSVVADLLK